MRRSSLTSIGVVTSVNGASVTARLHNLPSSLMLHQGESFRIGQIGSMYSVQVGLVHLIAICDGVQAGTPKTEEVLPVADFSDHVISLTLFGEVFQGEFNRGVGQYPTVGDEVHIVDERRLRIIYNVNAGAALELGFLSASPSLGVSVRLDRMVTRHSAVFGATGSGKSNFVALALEKLTGAAFPTARVLIIDPHDEYGHLGACFSTASTGAKKQLDLPYWALPLDALMEICQLTTTPQNETAIREWVFKKKCDFAAINTWSVPQERITADSPIPFSIRELWFEFHSTEIATYQDAGRTTRCTPTQNGDAKNLVADKYPPHAAGSAAPYAPASKGLSRQLDALRSILLDSRFKFLFDERFDPCITPAAEVVSLNTLVASWIGGPDRIASLDLSIVDAKVDSVVAGALLSIVYEFVFWGQGTKISGTEQPLLVVIDEAHRLLPQEQDTIMSSIVKRIAKEGRKFGVGLMIVTQRPSELNETILSQIGSVVALRTTNASDRSKILSVVPDEFGALGNVLPALRNGEAFVVGEAVPIPTRMRTDLAQNKNKGADPEVATAWGKPDWPEIDEYKKAYEKWLERSI